MRKLAVLVFCLCSFCFAIKCTSKQKNTLEKVKSLHTQNVEQFYSTVNKLVLAVQENKPADSLRGLFKKARLQYKSVEVFAEYYNPTTAKAINGPALPEAEMDNPQYPTPPTGFQVVEELLFPVYDTATYKELLQETKSLQAAAKRLCLVNNSLEFTEAHVWDAIRLELFRTTTLGITGFDSPIAQESIQETAATLISLDNYISLYENKKEQHSFDSLKNTLQLSVQFLNNNTNFNAFDRATFIQSYLNPLCKQLFIYQQKINIPFFNEPRFLNAQAATLFDKDAFNAWFYSPSLKNEGNDSMIVLGKLLFNENLLSSNNSRNCASCHQESKAFTDGLAKSTTFTGTSVVKRNTPTILYSSLQASLFADTRLTYLEDQAKQVVENPAEMHGNLSIACSRLYKERKYTDLFERAFKEKTITPEKIQQAIAAYIRTKNKFNSRFDNYMQGAKNTFTEEEKLGFNLFAGKAKCATCHFIPLFNSTVPPAYTKMEAEIIGVPKQNKAPYSLDEDEGKYALYKASIHRYAFKTPTLRNIALTAPYMHNGVFNTLEEVMDFYNKGGGIGLGLNVPHQTLPTDKLNLTPMEIKAIIAFMKTLNDQ